MKKKSFQKKIEKKKKAFSLIDLSVLILVLSVLIVGFISVNQSEVINNKFFRSSNNFPALYSALASYVKINKKLPCPASLTEIKNSSSSYAVAASDSNCVLSGVYQSNSATNLVYGMVPAKTLGLDNSLAEDSYGNKIIYIVDKRLTQAGDSFETNIMNSAVINIADRGISDAIFILMSRGENSLAAFSASSNQITSASTNAQELENDLTTIVNNTSPAVSTANFDNIFYQSANDDLLFYKNYQQFFNDYNLWDLIPCSSASSTESLYNSFITWPKAYPNQIVAASTSCPEGFQGGVSAPTKKCGNKGEWSSVVEHCSESQSTSCSVSITGSSTTSVLDGSGSFSCDQTGYSGEITYTCNAGVFDTLNACAIESEATGSNCTGGVVDTTSVANNTIHIFNSSATLSCPSARTAQVLVVGGGGGGGSGGGGGGGVVYNASVAINSGNNSVTVGTGGSQSSWSPKTNATNGGNSVFASITAFGGGAGGQYSLSQTGFSGASSGGGSCDYTGTNNSGTQGGNGGVANRGGFGASGGGGGAGGDGSNSTSQTSGIGRGGNGGVGTSNSIIGSAVFYGGGGGGGANTNSSAATDGGLGGNGGGGDGARSPSSNGSNATANTGGGGGGGECEARGGSGGSGVVIIRYANSSGVSLSCPSGYSLVGTNCLINCQVAVAGVSTPTSVTGGSGNLTCNATGYSGLVAYSCGSSAVLSTSTSCSCAAGHTGGSCQSCLSGYTKVNGVCTLGCSTGSTVGINTQNVNAGTGTLNCNASNFNTADSINYSCSSNVFSITSGACDSCTSGYTFASNSCNQNCTINGITGITNGTAVNHNSTSITCNASNYTGTINYTCNNGTFNQTSGSCTLAQPCTGGTVTTVSNQTVHTFTSNGTLSCPSSKTAVRILVVGGGGSGGTHPNSNGTPSGGGGGGVIYGGNVSLPSGNYTISIGAGGSRGGTTACGGLGVNGANTSFTSGSVNLTAVGGGAGSGCNQGNGGSGGSSGGSNLGASTAVTLSTISGLSGLTQYGNIGGSSFAGGGGASAQGQNGSSTNSGNGGQGYPQDISGTSIVYGSGGGGAASTGGVGGTNAGNGSSNGNVPGSGVANRGGGGGAGNGARAPGSGGSGVVIIRYTP